MITKRKFQRLIVLIVTLVFGLWYGIILDLDTQALSKTIECTVQTDVRFGHDSPSSSQDFCQLPAFNSNNGILQQVAISYDVQVASNVAVENLLPSQSLVQADWNVRHEVRLSDQTNEGNLKVQAPSGVLDFVPGYDGTLDYLGESSREFPELVIQEKDYKIIVDKDVIGTFISKTNGFIQIPIVSNAQLLSSSAQVALQADISSTHTINVEYIYNLPDLEVIIDTAKSNLRDSLLDLTISVINLGNQAITSDLNIYLNFSQEMEVVETKYDLANQGNNSQFVLRLDDYQSLGSMSLISIPLTLRQLSSTGTDAVSVHAYLDYDSQERDKKNNSNSATIQIGSDSEDFVIELEDSIGGTEPLLINHTLLGLELDELNSRVMSIKQYDSSKGTVMHRNAQDQLKPIQDDVLIQLYKDIYFVPTEGESGNIEIHFDIIDTKGSLDSRRILRFAVSDSEDNPSGDVITMNISPLPTEENRTLARTGGITSSRNSKLLMSSPLSNIFCVNNDSKTKIT